MYGEEKNFSCVLFGAGKIGTEVLSIIKSTDYLCSTEIKAFIDNDNNKSGASIEGIPIEEPQKLTEIDPDYIILSTYFCEGIREQCEYYGFSSERIITLDQYKLIAYPKYRFMKRYGSSKNTNRVFSEKIIVYSAMFGERDVFHEPEYADKGIDYVLFTDNHSVKSNVWNIEYASEFSDNPRMAAKKIKVLPHKYWSEYDTSIWVDAKFLIRGSLKEYMRKYERTQPMLCFPHPCRNCIYEEAAECVRSGIGVKMDIIHQISDYYMKGYKADMGLFEGGCIIRAHNNPGIITLMEEWFKQIQMYSYRDQISLAYLCNVYKLLPDISDLNIDNNEYLYMARTA